MGIVMTRYLTALEVKAARYFKLNPGDMRETVMATWTTEEVERVLADLVEDYQLCTRSQRGKHPPLLDGRFVVQVREERRLCLWRWCEKIGTEQRRRLGVEPLPQDRFILSGADKFERLAEMREIGIEIACQNGFVVAAARPGRELVCRRATKVVFECVRQAFYGCWSDEEFKSRLLKRLSSYCKSFTR